MRYLLLATCFIFHCFHLAAQQDWDLFPPAQRSYVQVQDELFLYYNDSTEQISDGERIHYFGAHYLQLPTDLCTKEIRESALRYDDNPLALRFLQIDTLYSNDTFYYQANTTALRFYHRAPVGFSWQIPTVAGDSIRLTVAEQTTETIQNFTDSVKIIRVDLPPTDLANHPLNGFTFKLGKQLGLLQWIEWSDLYHLNSAYKTRRLYSFQKNGTAYGFTGAWSDFFHPEPGEVYKYEYQSYAAADTGPGQQTDKIIRDSVVEVTYTDSIIYTKINQDVQVTYTYHDGRKETFYEEFIEKEKNYIVQNNSFFAAPTHFPFMQYYDANGEYVNYDAVVIQLKVDRNGIYLDEYQRLSEFTYSDNCYIETVEYPNLGFSSYHTQYGSYSSRTENNYDQATGGTSLRLIGYQTAGGTVFEDVEIITSNQEISLVTASLKLFPNPVQQTLHLQLEEINSLDIERIEIFRADGKRMLTLATVPEQINVHTWSAGLYFLKYQTRWGVERQVRFLKL